MRCPLCGESFEVVGLNTILHRKYMHWCYITDSLYYGRYRVISDHPIPHRRVSEEIDNVVPFVPHRFPDGA